MWDRDHIRFRARVRVRVDVRNLSFIRELNSVTLGRE